ncbi:MAG: esterase [Prevotellaceae bacterium]|jgi:enterochelin esterase family protein|nr:esterase [Prevotellaceae bacterium]
MKKNRFYTLIALSVVALTATAQTFVTAPPAGAAPGAARPSFRFPARVISPEVHDNGTVTFRFSAPQATKVELSGQFLKKNLPMTKDENGLWSVTTGKVKPDIYPYNFVVDGITVADPNNVDIFPNERFKGSLLDVKGKTPSVQDLQDVPHGKVTYAFYHSKSLDLERPLLIYTPPGYTEDTQKSYPVLYLIHGMTDTQETWYKVGRMNYILDNLIAQGEAEPMIVVMPYANAYPALMKKNPGTQMNLMSTDMFTNELLKEIIPYTEANYRAKADRDSRAIAGFSLGGRQTLGAGLGHPDVFAYVCPMAPAVFPQGLDQDFKETYAPIDQLRTLKLLWIGCGKDDSLYAGSKALAKKLGSLKVKYETLYSPGGHTWMNCRLFLATIAPKLFK